MSTKVLENTSIVTPYVYYYKQSVIRVGTNTNPQQVSAGADWSRVKPPCLWPTTMRITESRYDPRIVESGDRDGYWMRSCGRQALGTLSTRNWASAGTGGAAMNRARDKMAGSDLNFGETLAELGEAYNLVLGAATRVAAAAVAVKNGRFGKAANVLAMGVPKGRQAPGTSKSLASNWLGYQFGVRPIISDAYNLANHLPTRQTVGTPVSKRSGGHKDAFGDPTTKATYRGVVSNPGLRQLSELGLANPANLAWQLLPLSFLADWFFGIGTFLNAFTSGLGLTCVSGTVVTQTGFYQSKPDAPNFYAYRIISRTPTNVGVIPSLDFSRSAAMSTGQIFTLAALLRSL